MDRVAAVPNSPNLFGEGKRGYLSKNVATGQMGTPITGEHLNQITESLVRVIEAAGLVPDGADFDQLVEAITLMAGSQPYDVPFLAGWSAAMAHENVAVRLYGSIVMPRAIRITGAVAKIEVAPTGADMIFDVRKNGATIWGTPPKFAAGATVLSGAVLGGDDANLFAAGDVLDFVVVQVGSGEPGEGVRFAAKGVTA